MKVLCCCCSIYLYINHIVLFYFNTQGLDFILLGSLEDESFMSDEDIPDGRMTPFDDARQRNKVIYTSSSEEDDDVVEGEMRN